MNFRLQRCYCVSAFFFALSTPHSASAQETLPEMGSVQLHHVHPLLQNRIGTGEDVTNDFACIFSRTRGSEPWRENIPCERDIGNVLGPMIAPVAGDIACCNGAFTLKDCPTPIITDSSSDQPNMSQSLQITNAGPGAAAFVGTKDYVRASVNDFPATSEYGSAPGSVTGAIQGIVGAVALNPDAPATAQNGFGVAGYASQGAGGNGSAAVGVYGAASASGPAPSVNHGLVVGLGGLASNSPYGGPVISNTGFNYVNMTGAEIDLNVMKQNGTAPNINVVGVSIVGASEVAPDLTGGLTNAAILINPLGVHNIPRIQWKTGITILDDSVSGVGLQMGATGGPGGSSDSTSITMTAYNKTAQVATIQELSSGQLYLSAPTGGQVALQVNNTNILNATTKAVVSTQPIFPPSGPLANLPPCNAGEKGAVAAVTDADAPIYAQPLRGGGTTWVLAFCNGKSWTAH
jgi:hypothetical protein